MTGVGISTVRRGSELLSPDTPVSESRPVYEEPAGSAADAPAREGYSTWVALSSTWRPRRAAGSDVVRARSQVAAVASASASLKTRESDGRFEGRRADPLAGPGGRPRSLPGETRSSRHGKGARTRAIRHATAATAAPSGSAARQRLARRLEPVFCSARIRSTKAGDNVISGRALETQARRARRRVS